MQLRIWRTFISSKALFISMSLSSLKSRLEHHLLHFGVGELPWAVLGTKTSPSIMLDQTKLPAVRSFCHLGSVWWDSVGITGLSYHTETWCSLWQLYKVCWNRVDLCSLGWRFSRLSGLSCCCTGVRPACCTWVRFVSWGISPEITFIFFYSVTLRRKKWQADQWERPALYWLSFIRRFEVFWSINKEGLAVLIYTSSSQNCQSISYTVLQKYPESWIQISWELFWPLDGKKKKKRKV